jgi:hypothetical protein
MPSSLNGTGVTFNDGTQLNSKNDAGGNYIMRKYTSPATWTKPAGLKAVKITILGGGGGGGGGRGSGSTPEPPNEVGSQGGGGARGGFGVVAIPAPTIPGPVTVTIGGGGAGGPAPGTVGTLTAGSAGGTSSFGPLATATGGGGAPATSGTRSNPGAASVAAGGVLQFNAPDNPAAGAINEVSLRTSGTRTVGRKGADAWFYGTGGTGGPAPIEGGDGATGTGNGAGGGGGWSRQGPVPGRAGGAGRGGLMIVEEFY